MAESLDVAETFIEVAPYKKSSFHCLNDDFFYESLDHLDQHLFDELPRDEAEDLAEAASKSRQELFKEARYWPWPYLIASAVYKIFSTEGDKRYVSGNLLWVFLCFDEPLFDMLRSKKWDRIYKNQMRKGFKEDLWYKVRGLTTKKFVWGSHKEWGSDKDKPWFTCDDFTSHIYPQDVLRCMDLVGIDQDLAQSAIDDMFKLKSLIPFYNILCDDPSEMLSPEI